MPEENLYMQIAAIKAGLNCVLFGLHFWQPPTILTKSKCFFENRILQSVAIKSKDN